ncbi:hypothetical protein ACFQ1M_10990 [Sungkyunkwania multivorans]|uniref:Prenyltransferase n=1 Tax=Sungkyunkwania multivorans TaxID=1173618 RepID=A0ABW3CY57_9FLAO
MRWLKQIFNFYLDSSIHVALAIYALVRITLESFNILYGEALCYFIFYGSIVSYNFIKYGSNAKKFFVVRTTYVRWIQVLSFVAFGLTVFYAVRLSIGTLLWAAGIGLISLLYILPFLPRSKSMRMLSGLKIYIVALCWAATTVWLPLVNSGVGFTADLMIELIQRFLFVLVITLPFEIRDLSFDSLALATIPQRIGVRKTKILGISLLFSFYLLSFLKNDIYEREMLVNMVIVLISALFLVFARKEQTTYYSGFFVESIPVIWMLLLLYFN